MMKATADILRAARNNPAITSSSLFDEVERQDINGWLHLDSVRWGNLSDWTAAMNEAAVELHRLEEQKKKAAARRNWIERNGCDSGFDPYADL